MQQPRPFRALVLSRPWLAMRRVLARRQSCPVCGRNSAMTRGRLWPWSRMQCWQHDYNKPIEWLYLSYSPGFNRGIFEMLKDRAEMAWAVARGRGCRECWSTTGFHRFRCPAAQRNRAARVARERLARRRAEKDARGA